MTNIIINPYRFASYAPASMVFNGTDEVLSRTNATTSPSTIAFTISIWAKGALTSTNISHMIVARADGSNFTRFLGAGPSSNAILAYNNVVAGSSTGSENSDSNGFSNDSAWHHYVFRYDSANGTVDNRAIFERDGSVVNDTAGAPIGASEACDILANGRVLAVGSHPTVFAAASFKIAFVDFVDGQALAASSFGFDNAGTWTRKKYAGFYGTYGFSLDGSTGILGDDVSPNGLDFTGTNMDSSNLDTGDLPPYTN
jgi:hypothetical protein